MLFYPPPPHTHTHPPPPPVKQLAPNDRHRHEHTPKPISVLLSRMKSPFCSSKGNEPLCDMESFLCPDLRVSTTRKILFLWVISTTKCRCAPFQTPGLRWVSRGVSLRWDHSADPSMLTYPVGIRPRMLSRPPHPDTRCVLPRSTGDSVSRMLASALLRSATSQQARLTPGASDIGRCTQQWTSSTR